MRIEQLDEPREDLGVRTVPAVERLELLHLGERKSEHLELQDELQAADVVVGVDTLAAVEAFHGLEKTALLVVADRPLGQADLRGDLADPVCRGRRRRHVRQFTSTGRRTGQRRSSGAQGRPVSPAYSDSGRMIRLAPSCSRQWAAHPATRDTANVGVKRSTGMPRPCRTRAVKNSTFVRRLRPGLYSSRSRRATRSTSRASSYRSMSPSARKSASAAADKTSARGSRTL